jgi:hypothetical protein
MSKHNAAFEVMSGILCELEAVRKEKEKCAQECERLGNILEGITRKKEWTSPDELDPSEFPGIPIVVKILDNTIVFGKESTRYVIWYLSSPEERTQFRDDVASGLIVEWAPLFDFLKR